VTVVPPPRPADRDQVDLHSGAALVVRAVLWQPTLWPTAVRSVLRLARSGWWRAWPPVPLPGAAYWAFRVETAVGGEVHAATRRHAQSVERPGGRADDPVHVDARLGVEDVREYLRWCRGWDRMSR